MTAIYDELHSRLKAEKKRLLDEITQLRVSTESDEARREGSPFGKREEEATESFELEKRLALQRQKQEQLADVEQALDKFEKGTYGRCDICGNAISPARLEALPHARVCVECKAKGKVSPA